MIGGEGGGEAAQMKCTEILFRGIFFMLSIYTALQVAVLQEDHRFGQTLCRHRVDGSCGR